MPINVIKGICKKWHKSMQRAKLKRPIVQLNILIGGQVTA